ncbi:MAG TPA: M48 family metallopeptidase [Polyangiaceae bacterium]
MWLAFLAVYALVLFAGLGLSFLNLRHQARAGHRVPPELDGVIEPERLRKIEAYTQERARFGMLERLVSGVAVALFLFFGPLAAYDRFVAGLGLSFVASGVVFVLGLMLLRDVLELPFSLYSTFAIEARHGFNRTSPGLFFADLVKSTLLSLVFAGGLGALAFWVVTAAPHFWWLWVWAVFVAFSVLITFLAPYVIEPLFFKMKPLQVAELNHEVRELAERAGVHVGRVLEMDASRRSAHSNAYFTGFGRVKRVVLFDTLLSHMTRGEILAVLAHELGHWKKHHVLIRAVVSFGVSLLGLFVAFHALPAAFVPELVGLEQASFPARVVVLAAIAPILTFPLTPLAAAWSRHDERSADRFAVDLSGRAGELADALAKLSRENLSNLHPHPLYAKFYYSHPPVTERIRTLRGMAVSAAGPA